MCVPVRGCSGRTAGCRQRSNDATLEGNFIYWMTGAYIPVGSDEVRARITDNLREEVRDCHPWMMRRLASPALLAHSDLEAEMSEGVALLSILIQNIVVNN